MYRLLVITIVDRRRLISRLSSFTTIVTRTHVIRGVICRDLFSPILKRYNAFLTGKKNESIGSTTIGVIQTINEIVRNISLYLRQRGNFTSVLLPKISYMISINDVYCFLFLSFLFSYVVCLCDYAREYVSGITSR